MAKKHADPDPQNRFEPLLYFEAKIWIRIRVKSRIRISINYITPDPHQGGKWNPDSHPDPHQSDAGPLPAGMTSSG
jgi:hypothetical protein